MYCLFRFTTRWQQKTIKRVSRKVTTAVTGTAIPRLRAKLLEQSVQIHGVLEGEGWGGGG